MKYQDRNFLKLQERQKQNPKESKRDYLIRIGVEKKYLRFYKKTAYKIYNEDYWCLFTNKQKDEIIRTYNSIGNILFLNTYVIMFPNEESWLKYAIDTYKPDSSKLRELQLKKLGI